MEDIDTLLTIVLVMTGFGLVLLLGTVLPRDLPEDDASEREE
jgi:hypothetical protein